MPKVSLLPIDDSVVGPHLQLLRQICEPSSVSRPHVTVRYFERLQVPEEYRRIRVAYIDLIGPGMFKPSSGSSAGTTNRSSQTVFIRCKSDDLTPLEHKPHFPESDFHITIYDGKSRIFARRLLGELQKFKWCFRVPLSKQALTFKELRAATRSRTSVNFAYDVEVEKLFMTLTSSPLSRPRLVGLRNADRLKLVRLVLRSLFQSTVEFEPVSLNVKASLRRSEANSNVPDLPEVHLTPPELAQEIAEYAVGLIRRDQKIEFGDPAVGTGAFYAALLRLVPRERLESAIGVDINSEQVEAARWRWSDKGMVVLKGDYLHMDKLPRRSLILANPPYLRHQRIPADYKSRLLELASVRTDIRLNARAGLYVYFLLLSHDWMCDDAVAAWLIPSEFMRSVYGADLRRYLSEKVELIRIHEYRSDVPQFENADVSPAVVVFRNRKPTLDHDVLLTEGGRLRTPNAQQRVSVDALRRSGTWTIPLEDKSAETERLRVGHLFKVRRGIATGANSFFVMTRARAKELGIPKSAIKPLLPKVRTLKSDVVEANSDGYPKVTPQLCVIDCDLPQDKLRRQYPALSKYLAKAKGLGILKRRLLRDRTPWYKQEQRDVPPYLCTYMGRGSNGKLPLRFIWNKSQAIATNTYLLLYPHPSLAKVMKRPGMAARLYSILQEAATKEMHKHARRHAGGLLKIEPRELLNVPLAVPAALGLSELDAQLSLF